MNLKTLNWILLTLILVLILASATLYVYSADCQNNPFTFGAKMVKKKAGVDIECSCYAIKTVKPYEPMHFTSEKLYFGDKDINFSEKLP